MLLMSIISILLKKKVLKLYLKVIFAVLSHFNQLLNLMVAASKHTVYISSLTDNIVFSINHSIFWTNLSPHGGEPSGELLNQIKSDFGSLENLQKQLSTASIGVQGSGWGWLGYCKNQKKLKVHACQNQDPLEATTGLIPLFG